MDRQTPAALLRAQQARLHFQKTRQHLAKHRASLVDKQKRLLATIRMVRNDAAEAAAYTATVGAALQMPTSPMETEQIWQLVGGLRCSASKLRTLADDVDRATEEAVGVALVDMETQQAAQKLERARVNQKMAEAQL